MEAAERKRDRPDLPIITGSHAGPSLPQYLFQSLKHAFNTRARGDCAGRHAQDLAAIVHVDLLRPQAGDRIIMRNACGRITRLMVVKKEKTIPAKGSA